MAAAIDDTVNTLNTLRSPNARVVIDVRARRASIATAEQDSILEALRGLIQGYVAESGGQIGPVNLVVTTADQTEDRDLTWTYLADPDGAFARGATFDLREE
ncbi:hypothetical protein [Glaciihabitans sp. UYNi722]|uniref:hypothetical protein n=1 Tax=Glaciihabitans sp. UYNi722 TaxID=3156344 RepID=UPI0033910434